MRTLLEQVSKKGYDPEKLLGNFSFSIDAKDLLKLGSWENVCEHVALAIIRNLERERSTLGLLQNMSERLDLRIKRENIDAALPFLEARHYLVHSDGKPDQVYRSKYPNMKLYKANGKIEINYDFVVNMRDSVRKLIAEYDDAVIARNLLRPEDVHP